MTVQILIGDVVEQLRTLPDGHVQTVITSPPYFAQRSYLPSDHPGKALEIGLEATPEEFVDRLVGVFREVRRVLRDDGTLWVNIGDTAASGGRGGGGSYQHERSAWKDRSEVRGWRTTPGMHRKSIIGIPWMLAFALRADGWILRSEIIWHKPNTFPESVIDRPTRSHEQIFLLSKSARYYYDWEAISEPTSPNTHARAKRGRSESSKWFGEDAPGAQTLAKAPPSAGRPSKRKADAPNVRSNADFAFADKTGGLVMVRNKRSVWELPTAQFGDSHYATFPPDLIEPCVLAGAPRGGVVLDPFGGSGTVGEVADRHQRQAILIDLDERNERMMRRRLEGNQRALPMSA